MSERGLQLFIICFLHVVLGRPQLDVQVTDERQAAKLRDSLEHHIVVPYSVDNDGNFLSHDLHHHRTRRSPKEEQVHYHIPFKNEKFHLMLTRNDDFVVPGLVIEWRSGKLTSPISNCHFTGSLKNNVRSSVAISNCYGLAGMIRASDDKEYFIEPVRGIDLEEHDGKHPHVIYRRSTREKAKKNDTEPKCGVTAEDVKVHPDIPETPAPERKGFYLKRTRRSVSLMKHVETLLVADYTMTEFYGSRDLEHYLLTIMNMVNLIFKHRSIGSAINIALVRMIILDKEQEDGLNVTNHARNTLNDFCSWVGKINPSSDENPKHADAAVLVTRKDICRDSQTPCQTLGLSNVDGLCLPGSACSYNEDSGFTLAYTIAHELAHNLGSLHDDDYSNCQKLRNHLMASTLVVKPSQNVWSKCTRKAVKSFLYKGWGWCLNDKPGTNIQPTKRRMLPGEEFGVNEQCKFTFGFNSTACAKTDPDLCAVLWCTDESGKKPCITKFSGLRALDGTPCGKTKWCIRGKCKTMTYLKQPVDGDWGHWTSWSACSKSCGRGVRRKTRKCNSPRPEYGGNYCVGEWKKYSVCYGRPCPAGSASRIESQCKKFRALVINGKRYTWKAKENNRNPCELRCEPVLKKGHSQFRKFIQLEDGTSCNHGTNNICIQGKCEHVGCDNKLYSSAREDRCGVCRGDGSTCETKREKFDKPKGKGYIEAMVIPAGARNIIINEVSASPNFLALKSSRGKYFLNGDWYIQWEGKYDVAGVDGFYSRRHNKETFKAKGPIKEDLHVVLLYQAQNPGLDAQYDVERHGRPVAHTFQWTFGPWTECSVTCGQGIQRRQVKCIDEKHNIVDDQHCKNQPPPTTRICNRRSCPPSWWVGAWHQCSKTCGLAVRFRPILCTQIIQDRRQMVDGAQCREKKPVKTMICRQPQCWIADPWSKCSSSCGPGIQYRQIRCPGGSSNCRIATRPATNRTCIGNTCHKWTVGEWGQCSVTCGNGTKYRNVECEKPEESKCDQRMKPPTYEPCPGYDCPVWSTGNWSECSVTCGEGIQRRNVTCDPSSPKLSCKEAEKPLSIRPCLEKICSGWTVGEWGSCSASCGEGIRVRKVVCTNKSCEVSTRPKHKEACNSRKCPEWSAGEWSECSTTCGKGSQYRNVTCSERNVTCSDRTKLPTTKECFVSECSIWIVGNWTECSATCGDGIQTREIECNATIRSLCEGYAPATEKICHKEPCAEWKIEPWSQCSRTCGTGVQNRTVWCSGLACDPLTKPNSTQECFSDNCAVWVTGNWGECSVDCGEGVQKRQVYCSHDDESECNFSEKPEANQDCFVSHCSGWIVTRWEVCSAKCGMGLTKRNVTCGLTNGKCLNKPRVIDICISPPCTKWSTGQWSPCSVSCGHGIQRRIVSCTGGRCTSSTKPSSTKECEKPDCPVWRSGNWSQCSVSCGDGFQVRDVFCETGGFQTCDNSSKPTIKKQCNNFECPYWSVGFWGNCSSSCGNGTRSRTVHCISNSSASCPNSSKPVTQESCFSGKCPTWIVGNWSVCSVTCGGGITVRVVICQDERGGNCSGKIKPTESQPCGEEPCPHWSVGNWTECSKSCGGGVQSRVVSCENHLVGNCHEHSKPASTRECGDAPCPKWLAGQWTKCSATCGGGVQFRNVSCGNSSVGTCSNEDKPDITRVCGTAPCPKWSTGLWSKCSKTCGHGKRTRTVLCRNNHVGNCSEEDKPKSSEICGTLPCPKWTVGEWSKCSRTCGGGTQSRSVNCENNHVGRCLAKDKPNTIQKCGELPCPEWIVSEWSKCSKTCGGGMQSRTVTCRNSHVGECSEAEKPDNTKKCGDLPCPKWSVSEWSKCSKTCAGGYQVRTVTCKNSHVGECSEKEKPGKTKKCGELPCPEWTVREWSKCSRTCGGGAQSRTVTCKNSHVGPCSRKDKPDDTKKCGDLPCPEWIVGKWRKCSKTCGGGYQSRTVTCKNSHVGKCLEKEKPGRTKKCGNLPCPEWTVGEWRKCSKTCGGGYQSRTVTCKNNHVGKCSEKEKPGRTEKCGNLPCPEWTVGEWRKCSKTCGGGYQSRTVTCKNSHVGKCLEKEKPGKTKTCGELPCPQWIVGKWSECSKTCGAGTQSRTVICKNGHVGKCSETDKPSDTKKCGHLPCPKWASSEWSKCSKTCGGGMQSRTVTCKNSHVGPCPRKDKPDNTKKCGDLPCPEWIVGEWRKCSKTCGGGYQVRTVTCKNNHVGKCLEKEKPGKTKKCGELPCPEWIVSEWGKCSKTCGGGMQSRTVTCRNSHVGECSEAEKPDNTKKCGDLPCPQWIVGKWSECSKTCGGGTQSRTVTCKNGHVGRCSEKDKPNNTKKCGYLLCPEWTVGNWSKCSRTCGGGTQSRIVNCKNLHVGECPKNNKPSKVKKCGDFPCPQWIVSGWSKCSRTCGGGIRSRTVNCKNSHVGKCSEKDKPTNTKKCGELPCPQWTVGEWSKCSKTCGGGVQSRSVICTNQHVGECAETDKPTNTKKCGSAQCPQWTVSEWSKCSKTCGGGIQIRNVSCSSNGVGKCPEDDKPTDRKMCGEVPCPKWLVGKWSKCSKTCGSGEKVRKVWCSGNESNSCPEVKPVSHRTCNKALCPKWIVSEWSKCVSRRCGHGKRYRDVTCSGRSRRSCNRKEKPTSRESCTVECPKWKTSEWSECHGLCKNAKIRRRVWCVGGDRRCKLKNKPISSKLCTPSECLVWSVGLWSACPVTCGGSIRGRSVRCLNKGTGQLIQGCDKSSKPPKLQACGLTLCPLSQDRTKSVSKTRCYQAKDDTYFCNLLLQPSLSELCLYGQWKRRCCRSCFRVNAQRRYLK